MRNRIAWTITAVALGIAVGGVLFGLRAAQVAAQEIEMASGAVVAAYELQAHNAKLLVEGLTHLQEREDDLGYEYLELLLRTKLRALENLDQSVSEDVPRQIEMIYDYFEKVGVDP